ncbi:choice-of-anchor D domain-containing protein [Bdellovibrio bacteriovorus]
MKYFLFALLTLSLSAPTLGNELPNEEMAPSTLSANQTIEVNGIEEDDVSAQTRYLFYNFGRVRLYDSESQRFYIRNTGRLPVYINDIDISGSGFWANENCPSLLWPGFRCSIRVTFRPNHIGIHNGRLNIWLTGAEDVVIYLRGRGVWGF